MKRILSIGVVAAVASGGWLLAQSSEPSVVESFRMVEVASVSDAMEQLYGQRAYMAHDVRPLAPAKFAGPAVTVVPAFRLRQGSGGPP
jgi:4-hydroxy-4-methyl-2-oxoglutarate aldolase